MKNTGGITDSASIVETEAQNISDYIPTNLISITDGQLYLSPVLFELGVLPAIDIGKSVSRVGGKTQLPVYRHVSANLNWNMLSLKNWKLSPGGTSSDEKPPSELLIMEKEFVNA